MNRSGLWNLPTTEEDSVGLLKRYGVLPPERKCTDNHPMKLHFGRHITWRCSFHECKHEVNLRVGNWFENSRIPFITAVRFIYCWCWELTSVKFCEHELGMNKDTVADWHNYMREVICSVLDRNSSGKIGGKSKIVEVDAVLLSKRKNHMGRVLPEQWIIGGACHETKEVFLEKVVDSDVQNFLDVISKHVECGSYIYMDCLENYSSKELEIAEFEQFIKIRDYSFVDPETDVPLEHADRMWGFGRWRSKVREGTSSQHLESCLVEFLWRCSLREEDDRFVQALQAIKQSFPPSAHM